MREPNLSRSYVTPCIESIKYAETSNGESNNGHQSKSEAYTKMVSGSRRGRDIIKSLGDFQLLDLIITELKSHMTC